jgi:hypothetical protein
MAWIESHQSLGRHRKTLEVVGALRVDRHKLIGHLHELWWWGLDNADADGVVGLVPCEALAAAAGWPLKDAARFVDVLQSAGFLDATAQGYVLHDWFDYAGKLNTQRELRKASNREAQRRRRDRMSAPGHADVSADIADSQHDVSADIDDSQHSTGPDQPDLPPVGPLTQSPRPRARARGLAQGPPRRVLAETQDGPIVLRAEQQQCPLCPEVFPDNVSVREHLDNAPRHKVRPQRPETRALPPPVPAEIEAELAAMATRPPFDPATVPPEIRAEHERYLARARTFEDHAP